MVPHCGTIFSIIQSTYEAILSSLQHRSRPLDVPLILTGKKFGLDFMVTFPGLGGINRLVQINWGNFLNLFVLFKPARPDLSGKNDYYGTKLFSKTFQRVMHQYNVNALKIYTDVHSRIFYDSH